MALRIIVSYDGTTHDDDALMLAKMLQAAGAELRLAYVRHSREYDPRREAIAVPPAPRRRPLGPAGVGAPARPAPGGANPARGGGRAELAAAESAELVVFGSDYRTPPGRVEPQGSAQGMLSGGTVAVSVAAAGLRTVEHPHIRTVSVASGDAEGAAAHTARAPAAATSSCPTVGTPT